MSLVTTKIKWAFSKGLELGKGAGNSKINNYGHKHCTVNTLKCRPPIKQTVISEWTKSGPDLSQLYLSL